MRLYIQIPAIIVLGYLLELFLPWYAFAFVAFALGYVLSSESNFAGGFIGGGLLWALRMIFVNYNAAQDLPSKVAQIIGVNETWILILIALFIAGVVGGLACFTGGLLRGSREGNNEVPRHSS